MKYVLSAARFVVLFGVLATVAAAVLGFVSGSVQTLMVLRNVGAHLSDTQRITIDLVHVMDSFLVAAALLIFAFGLYELFIGKLDLLPPAMVVRDLDDLKAKLAGVVILVIAVDFAEHFVLWESGIETLLHAAAAALISSVLLLMMRKPRAHD